MGDCLVAKAKVAGSNPVFRSNFEGPAAQACRALLLE
jgi:hypothetical protein